MLRCSFFLLKFVLLNLFVAYNCLKNEALHNFVAYDHEDEQFPLAHNNNDKINCEIPNEDNLGVCLEVGQCLAYLQVRNATNLAAEKVNFLKKVQCVSKVMHDERARSLEPLVCCTANGQDYRFPSVKFTKFESKRFQNATSHLKRKKLKRRIQTVEPVEGFNLWNECGKQVTQRIYGGEIAELDEFPWLALFVYNNSK